MKLKPIKAFFIKPGMIGVYLLLAFVIGYRVKPGGETGAGQSFHAHAAARQTWTCSMHPQIQLPEAGQCPICFMDLIPLTSEEVAGPGELKLSEPALQLAQITTAKVMRGPARAELRLSGKIEYDETRVKTISAWVPGRLVRLFVDYTGIPVQTGDHLIKIYSPELYIAQVELLQSVREMTSRESVLSTATNRSTYLSSRRRLEFLGLTGEQIDAIEKRGTPEDYLTITSPVSGIVIHKKAVEGRYVDTGTPIYTIADLSRVWVVLDAYEADLPLLKFGQTVTFTSEARPGERFQGKITFIDPVLDTDTRTVKVRINLDNAEKLLKPGMFVRARVQARVNARGQAVNNQLAGKWISPMHPEVIKDHPGQCDVCGMELVPAAALGIITDDDSSLQPLLVPATAVLQTGRRALVYVRLPGRDEPTFAGREIILGPRVGDDYVVLSGLEAGEEVVTNGNFKIDSALQIAARPSMMSPTGGGSGGGHAHHGGVPAAALPDFTTRLLPLQEACSLAVAAVERQDTAAAQEALAAISFMAGKMVETDLTGAQLQQWRTVRERLLALTARAEHWTSLSEIAEAVTAIGPILKQLADDRNTGAGGHTHD